MAVVPSEKRLAISPKSSPSLMRLRVVSAFFFRSMISSRRFLFGVDFDGAQRNLLGADKFGFVLVVIFFDFVVADGDVRADLAADHALGQDAVADIIFEVLPVEPLGGDSLFEFFHAGQIILNADLVELLDDVGLDADAHVFAALDQQGLVDKVAQSIFLAVFDGNLQLFGGAMSLAFLLGIIGSSGFARCSYSDWVMISLLTRAMISSTTRPELGSILEAAGAGGFFVSAGLAEGLVSAGVSVDMPGFSSAGVAGLSLS